MITNSQLHYHLLHGIIDKGFAPTNTELVQHFETSEEEVEKALHQLQEYHGVVLHPNEAKVWVIHPFSLSPTNFYVKSESGQWWGNCAWCSLGIAAILKTDVTITTSLGAEENAIEVHIKDGKVQEQNLFIHFPIPMKNAWDNVIYTYSTMLMFESEAQVDVWSARHNIPKGDIQPIDKIWEFSRDWYGNHLDPNWTKWTAEEAKELFAKHNLTHPIWNLESSKSRF